MLGSAEAVMLLVVNEIMGAALLVMDVTIGAPLALTVTCTGHLHPAAVSHTTRSGGLQSKRGCLG